MAEDFITTPPARGEDLTGRKFGFFNVLGWRTENCKTMWVCRCACDKIRVILPGNLKSGNSESCGCKYVGITGVTHGMSYTKLYGVWSMMRSRCYNPKVKSYKDYGAKGICVTEPWFSSFEAFYADMGESYSEGLTIDRIHTTGHYCKENCRWATRLEQANNKTDNVRLEFQGTTHTMSEWARIVGISNKTIHARIKRGLSIHDALTIPVKHSIKANRQVEMRLFRDSVASKV